MSKLKCIICGKAISGSQIIALQIAYHIPNNNLYMTTNVYCKECNKNVVEPTIKEINEKLKLNYGGKNE